MTTQEKTIEEINKKIQELQSKVDELKNGNNKCVRWRAKDEGSYWHVCADGKATLFNESPTHKSFDNFLYKIGNYFKTREEAEKHYKHLIITQKLKDIALRLNDGKTSVNLYFIYLNSYGELTTACQSVKEVGAIYCLSDKFLETAIKEIGEQELIDYIKEG